ncbi:zinc ribbon domain-containing protein [Candidatus Pacearchaeota archaeon]|nr:zinc ribbon domain-containing protein [Candidatus Pacearchaeota archaeon]
MGISVPISVEHYKTLKMISDKLGIGLKKTLEYLVTYYSEREMLSTPSLETEINQIKEMIESKKEITLTSTASTTQIPPMMERIYGWTNSASKAKDSTQQEKQVISKPKTNRENCSACGTPKRENSKYCYNCGNLIQL